MCAFASECRKFCGPSKEFVFGKGTCSLSDTGGSVQKKGGTCSLLCVSGCADTKEHFAGAAAHLRLEIIVSLRTAASAEAPLGPMSLSSRLQGMGESSEE